MKTKHFIILVLCLFSTLSANAVLKEDSLANSLKVLRGELTKTYEEYSSRQEMMKQSSKRVFSTLIQTMQSSNQNALMLYSQKDDYVFNLTYACHEATKQYREFQRKLVPFMEFVEQSDDEVTRMDSLINCLKTMPVITLSEQAKTDRNVSLAIAVNLRHMIQENHDQLKEYILYYKLTEHRLKNLNDYANKKYNEIQNSIFVNGGDSYPTILSRFSFFIRQMKESVSDKYFTPAGVKSQWNIEWILGLFVVLLIYALIAVVINQIIIRVLITYLLKKEFGSSRGAEWFMNKRTAIIMASTVVTFAIILGFLTAFAEQNFIQNASGLLMQYAWLLGVVIISLMLRTKSSQTLKTLHVYLPLLVNGFVVISFRIILIPNLLVNLIFPPVLLTCCLWQWYVLHKLKQKIERSDLYFAYISQAVFVSSLICSVIGYTLFSVQILIWWIMQLTCILTIICMRDWYKGYAASRKLDELPIVKTWYKNMFYQVLLPVCGVYSIVLSLYWAADVFNLSELTIKLFIKPFVNSPNFSASIFSFALVASLWFIFNYVNITAKAFAKFIFEKRDPENAAQKFMMLKNVMQIFVWGVWFIISLAIFHVSNTWLVVIGGGFSTGIGFASKDILENIYYGFSLMMGRIKIGDLIVCDGVRGTVSSISYISTTIDTTDGSVIAFQNSQLFTKNYKNMTRNHGYELHMLDVGIAYGSNVKEAKRVIVKAVRELDCIDREKGVSVVLKELGDSALVLKVCVWLNVFTQYSDDGMVLEAVYDALNEAKIEIPYPHMDVSLING